MSSSIPSLNGREVIRAFERLGFVRDRTAGSHHIMKKAGHPKLISIPVHGNRPVKRGTLKGLIEASGHTLDEFVSAARE
jgi:predicted RNA binding protein YcfA (HicA-like mRNA interferase family)